MLLIASKNNFSPFPHLFIGSFCFSHGGAKTCVVFNINGMSYNDAADFRYDLVSQLLPAKAGRLDNACKAD